MHFRPLSPPFQAFLCYSSVGGIRDEHEISGGPNIQRARRELARETITKSLHPHFGFGGTHAVVVWLWTIHARIGEGGGTVSDAGIEGRFCGLLRSRWEQETARHHHQSIRRKAQGNHHRHVSPLSLPDSSLDNGLNSPLLRITHVGVAAVSTAFSESDGSIEIRPIPARGTSATKIKSHRVHAFVPRTSHFDRTNVKSQTDPFRGTSIFAVRPGALLIEERNRILHPLLDIHFRRLYSDVLPHVQHDWLNTGSGIR